MSKTLKVCNKQCNECLFTKNSLVTSEVVANQIIEKCLANDTFFQCHKGTIVNENICCRGFYEKYNKDVLALRLAQFLNVVEFVDVPVIEGNAAELLP